MPTGTSASLDGTKIGTGIAQESPSNLNVPVTGHIKLTGDPDIHIEPTRKAAGHPDVAARPRSSSIVSTVALGDPTMYRVCGVPENTTLEEFKEALARELFPNNPAGKIQGKPTMCLSCIKFNGNTQTALVQFTEVPICLKEMKVHHLSCWPGAIIDKHFHGMTAIYNGNGNPIKADIIAVTGLAAHAFGSWKGRAGSRSMWLRDFFPEDFPDCRVMVHGYDSDIHKSDGFNEIKDYATTLLSEIHQARQTQEEMKRPIIFIGHSLGGIIITHALVQSSYGGSVDYLVSVTKATVFFATPHRGLDEHAQNILDVLGDELTRSALVKSIKGRPKHLERKINEFAELVLGMGPKVLTYYEQKRTTALVKDSNGKIQRPKFGKSYIALKRDAAVVGVPHEILEPVNHDHSEIVKFNSKMDSTYQSLCIHLNPIIYPDARPKCDCNDGVCAVKHNNTERLEQLYREKNDNINEPLPRIGTLLHGAARGGIVKILNALIDLGAKVDARDMKQRTPLHCAVNTKQVEMVEALAKHTQTIWLLDSNGRTALDLAVMDGDLDMVEILVSTKLPGAAFINNVDKRGSTTLHKAAHRGDSKVVKVLLEKGAIVDYKDSTGNTALHIAASYGYKTVVKVLLEAGATASAKGVYDSTPLHIAAEFGHREVVEILLNSMAGIEMQDAGGCTALLLAAAGGYADVVAILVERGANVNAGDKFGQAALGMASEMPGEIGHTIGWDFRGFKDTIRVLLKKGADANTKDICGETALHDALNSLRRGVSKLLGVDVKGEKMEKREKRKEGGEEEETEDEEEGEEDEETEMKSGQEVEGNCGNVTVAFKGYVGILRILLNNKTNIRATDESWRSALHIASEGLIELVKIIQHDVPNQETIKAAFSGYELVLKVLLGRGADTNAKDDCGRTALNIVSEGIAEIEKILREGRQDHERCKRFLEATKALKGIAEILRGHVTAKADNNLREASLHSVPDVNDNVDIETKNNSGETTPHIASSTDNKSTLSNLDFHGTNVSVLSIPHTASGTDNRDNTSLNDESRFRGNNIKQLIDSTTAVSQNEVKVTDQPSLTGRFGDLFKEKGTKRKESSIRSFGRGFLS